MRCRAARGAFTSRKPTTGEISTRVAVAVLFAATLAGCSNMTQQQQRALSGGAIGAAAGAGIAALTGGGILLGGALGGAGGAAIGALTH
jgi:osmotically inducible lipoprotein OsmB